MTAVIKIKRNETTGNAPTTADIAQGEVALNTADKEMYVSCLLYTSPSPRDGLLSRMPSSA